MTYPLILQTISLVLQALSTLGGLVGVGVLIYVTFLLPRLHRAITDVPKAVAEQTTDLKQSIREQTKELSKT